MESIRYTDDVLSLTTPNQRIYFVGKTLAMIYNFGSAIMRSVGDTKLPFYSLLVATVCNFVLDWVFVAVFDFGVSGVAWATVIANGVNAAIIVYFLTREPEPVTLHLGRWTLHGSDFRKMLQIGIPAGLQGMVFSISNIFIQSAINKFGSDAIAGSAAALTYEVYCYYIIAGFCAAAIAFAGQNYGAGNTDRCRKVVGICMVYSVVLCGLTNLLITWQGSVCLSVFTSDPEVVEFGLIRFHTVLVMQCLASSYEVSGSYMRALGYSMTPMVLTIFGTCVLRLVWIYTYAMKYRSFEVLMNIYPITWIITGIMVITSSVIVQRRAFRKLRPAVVH